MSATKRIRSTKDLQLSQQQELSVRNDYRGSSVSFASSKSSPWHDDTSFILKQKALSSSEKELSNLQSTTSMNQFKRPKPIPFKEMFLRSLRGLWKTRYSDELKDKTEAMKVTLKELAIYVFFLMIACIITFGMTSTSMFYMTNAIQGVLAPTPPKEMPGESGDVFEYLKDTVIGGLYVENYYDDSPVKTSELGYIFFENKLLGRPRLRQVRVSNESCIVHEYFRDEIKECYAPYSPSTEFVGKFGLENGTAWEYQSEKELDGQSFSGPISTYGGGGYTVLFGADSAESNSIIDALQSNRWLDRGTRAVFFDFAVYNANINLFCVVRLLLEFPATGGCFPIFYFQTLKLLRYVTSMDYFVMACEAIFILLLIYYSIEEAIEIKKHGTSYFSDVWNVMDIIIVLLGFICVIFNGVRTVSVANKLRITLEERDKYANFEILADMQTKFNDLVAVYIFLIWIKLFKYLSFNKTMTQLQSTLSRCAKDIAGFSVMFFIVFFAYALWGYLLLGPQLADYSTYLNSIFACFRIILGDFAWSDINGAAPSMGPIFFISYVFMVFFILINMFLAIINDTYSEVKSDLAEQKDEFEIGDYFKKGYDKMMSNLSFKREKIVDIQKALQTADVNHDNMLDFEEWRAQLKLRGHADLEIEAVFTQYDLDGDRVLNEIEQQKMHDDLDIKMEELEDEIEEVRKSKGNLKKIQSKINMKSGDDDDDDEDDDENDSEPTGLVKYEEFSILARRVDRVEQSIGSMVLKIDSVLLKLEAMDKAKIKGRETMTKLLDSIAEQELSVFKEFGNKSSTNIFRPTSTTSKQSNDSVISIKEDHDGDDDDDGDNDDGDDPVN
ncbi:polycystin-2 isoform X1 [Hydra vulgaris]|uniref:polycystin-2 isoform X1 n=1 Tax=Hydra vulgaris TaxID=6087 RepID=UPI001F5ED3DF|nr:polycystin-2-like [Hydra vulgaris]